MTKRKIAVLVLAAGEGKRMKSARAKALHPLAGRPMIAHVLASVARLKPDRVVAVIGRGMDDVARAVRGAAVVVQHPRLGTAHAVRAAIPILQNLFFFVCHNFYAVVVPLFLPAFLRMTSPS